MMRRINISFYVFIFATLAVSLVMTALLHKASPLFSSKTLFFCQKYISNIMFEIPRSLTSTLILATGVVLGTGLLSFLVQLVKTRIFLRKLLIKRTGIPSNLTKILEPLSLSDKVILVKDKNLFSFCCGFFPFIPEGKNLFIVVSTGLVGSLTDKELEAVLLHEQSHLKSYDPVKVLIGKTFSSMFFFLPIFKELNKNIEAVSELLADQWTISRQETSVFLRRALKKILAEPQLNLAAVSNASGPDCFEIRIHRLINPGTKHKFRLSFVSLLTTFLFVLVSWFLLQTPVNASHMDTQSNSTYHDSDKLVYHDSDKLVYHDSDKLVYHDSDKLVYFLCSVDQSCSQQCHHETQKPSGYVPTYLFLPEKECNDDSNNASHSFSR